MDLPSHVLYTYAVEKISLPAYIVDDYGFITTSLVFSALPDVLESAPFLIYLYFNKKKYDLKGIRDVVVYAADITHTKQDEYHNKFPWASKLSFYSHSFLIYMFFATIFYLLANWLFLPFVIGYGFHLFIDMFMHKDYFSARPFYPLNNLSIPGFFTWYKEKNFVKYNFGILGIVYAIMIFIWLV